MITTRSYSPENLVSEVMETNKLMFDAWYWAAGEELKKIGVTDLSPDILT